MLLMPKPIKDYALKSVPLNQLHDEAFTPTTEPRVTQPTLGKYLVSCTYGEHENPSQTDQESVQELHPRVLDKWVVEARAMYVDKPGTNDYFLHELFRKYNKDDGRELDDRWQMRKKLFPRSYKYELHCLRHSAAKKLELKNHLEEIIDKRNLRVLKDQRLAKEARDAYEATKPPDCQPTPFWWQRTDTANASAAWEQEQIKAKEKFTTQEEEDEFVHKSLQDSPVNRWHQAPKIFGEYNANVCSRRLEMTRVGQPFYTEACRWYYENYPPPQITYIRKPLGS